MRILVPVDGSIPSRSVLQFVSDRAKQMPVMPVVQLLTVEPPVPSSGIGTMMELEAVRSAFAAEGERVFESLLAYPQAAFRFTAQSSTGGLVRRLPMPATPSAPT